MSICVFCNKTLSSIFLLFCATLFLMLFPSWTIKVLSDGNHGAPKQHVTALTTIQTRITCKEIP